MLLYLAHHQNNKIPLPLSYCSFLSSLSILIYLYLKVIEVFHSPSLQAFFRKLFSYALLWNKLPRNCLKQQLHYNLTSVRGFSSVVLLLHLMSAGAKTSWKCNWAETFKMIHTLDWLIPDVIWELYWGCWMEQRHMPLHVAWTHSLVAELWEEVPKKGEMQAVSLAKDWRWKLHSLFSLCLIGY